MKLLIDTNVLSEVQRPKGNPAVRKRLAQANSDDLFISVITIGEIAHGIARLKSSRRRRELEQWFLQTEKYFTDRILPIDQDVAQIWGELTAKAARKGCTLSTADGLIAATAIQHGLHLMTRNVADFKTTEVMLVNPWEDQ